MDRPSAVNEYVSAIVDSECPKIAVPAHHTRHETHSQHGGPIISADVRCKHST
jgi:hypothetical protein